MTMKISILFMIALSISTAAFANGAVIKANDGSEHSIALDPAGVPRTDGIAKSYPTIKDFRDGSDYDGFCYEGKSDDAKMLVTALVEAANGDGDSWANLKSIKLDLRNRDIAVVVDSEDERGPFTERFVFIECLK